jgi:hypothetical protein
LPNFYQILPNRYLAEIWGLLRLRRFGLLPGGERFNGAFKTI